MRLTSTRIVLISLFVGLAVAAASGIPVRWIWSSPGGSAYGIGFPMVYRFRYCGGYAPCYWAKFYIITFIEDAIIWFAIAIVILFTAKYVIVNKKKINK